MVRWSLQMHIWVVCTLPVRAAQAAWVMCAARAESAFKVLLFWNVWSSNLTFHKERCRTYWSTWREGNVHVPAKASAITL